MMQSVMPSDEYAGWVEYFMTIPDENEIQMGMLLHLQHSINSDKQFTIDDFMMRRLHTEQDHKRSIEDMTAEEMYKMYGV